MQLGLKAGSPRAVSSSWLKCWHVYTDAAYKQNSQCGGLGGVLFDDEANVCSWFGIEVSRLSSVILGAESKQSLIYELELAASITAVRLWGSDATKNLHVCYGDNDSVRFSLIRASGTRDVASSFMASFLEWEGERNCVTWFARVPTEANIGDYPSRFQRLEILTDDLCCNHSAIGIFDLLLEQFKAGKPH